MAGGEEGGGQVRRLVQALQVLRGAHALEVRGEWANSEEARAVIVDFVQVFKLDVLITELEDGFRVELQSAPQRTIQLEL
jgi:hypothetical protein